MKTAIFNGFLIKSGIMTEPQVREMIRDMSIIGPMPPDAQMWASMLVQQGYLTAYQAEKLLEGKPISLVIKGKYLIQDKIGVGGMGVVYRAKHLMINMPVALKVLKAQATRDQGMVHRFIREAQAGSSLRHPNIVQTLDFDEINHQYYLAMELVEGKTLSEIVKEDGPLPVKQAVSYIIQAAEGLQAIHEANWVHRDIKPGNLILDAEGCVKIMDMGLARVQDIEADDLTRRVDGGAVLGSADYIAPEQAMDSSAVDIRADIYSLGATLYYLLVGEPPFRGATVAEKLLAHQMARPVYVKDIRRSLPEGLGDVIDFMLAKNPDDRYQQPRDVVEALTPFAQGSSGVIHKEKKPPISNQNLVVAAVLGIIITTVTIVLAMLLGGGSGSFQDHFETAQLYMESNAWEKAAEAYARAVDAAQNDAGQIERVAHNVARHEQLANRLMELRPNQPQVLLVMSDRCAKQSRWEQAFQFLDRASKLDQRNPKLWQKQVEYGLQAGERVRVHEALDQLLATQPDNSYHWMLKAAMLASEDRAEEYEKLTGRLLSHFRSNINQNKWQSPTQRQEAYYALVLVPVSNLPLNAMIDQQIEVVNQNRNSGFQQWLLAAMYYRSRQWSFARVHAENMLRSDWYQGMIGELLLAMVDEQEGKHDQALRRFDMVQKWIEEQKTKAGSSKLTHANFYWWDWQMLTSLERQAARLITGSQ